jgi:general secretion pathway protein G
MNWIIGESANWVSDGAIQRVIGRLEGRSGSARNPAASYPITRLRNLESSSLSDRGFTMIELLVVVSLIVILATMGMSQYRSSVIHTRESVLKEDLFRMRDAIDQYYADKGNWPSTLDVLVSDGYMRKIPEDPFTRSTSSWQTISAEPDPNNPTAEPGISDVKSGSEATAIDGTKYSDW